MSLTNLLTPVGYWLPLVTKRTASRRPQQAILGSDFQPFAGVNLGVYYMMNLGVDLRQAGGSRLLS